MLVKLAGVLQRFIKWFVLIPNRLVAATWIVLRYLEANALGEPFDCLAKIEALILHDKSQRVAAGAAAKAIVELPLRVDGEGRCAFFMKRATGRVVFARFLQFYPTIYDLDDIEAIQKIIEKGLWKSCHALVAGVARSRAVPLAARGVNRLMQRVSVTGSMGEGKRPGIRGL